MKIATAGIMQEIDRKTIEVYGVPGSILMENAGRGAVTFILERYPEVVGRKVSVFCGAGNNGGDGYVISRYLMERGVKVDVYLLVREDRVKGDARIHFEILRHLDPRMYVVSQEGALEHHHARLIHSKLLVDAIFGTGLTSEVRGHYRSVIEWINRSRIPVVSVDIPSGIHADSGQVMGTAVRAQGTATFGMPKIGHFLYPGADHVGALRVVDIGIPKVLLESPDIMNEVLEASMFQGLLRRRADTHKGTYGHLFVLAGSPGKTGAACLCAEAALRVGAGLVTLGIAESVNPIMEQKLTEVMTLPLPARGSTLCFEDAVARIREFLPAAKAVVIGPGLGLDKDVERLVQEIWTSVTVPMVWDADALTILAGHPGLRGRNRAPVVATPHPGEMARLTATSTASIQQNRVESARRFSTQWNIVTVLKGAHSIIADPSGRVRVNPTGNPGMATGGMGDVLAGMIGGLLAQEIDPCEAACLAAFVHGAAGDAVAQEVGPVGYLASELLGRIPSVLRELAIT